MKLSAELRARAQKELAAGIKLSEVAKKFNITPSACSYLKQQVMGTSPGVADFEVEFNQDQRDRLKRLITSGMSYTEIAEDYEVPRNVIVSYCKKLGITVGVAKLPLKKKIKITPRGNGKRK